MAFGARPLCRGAFLRAALALVLTAAPLAAGGDRWPGFRGPNASGVAADGQNLPDRWSVKSGENIVWKKEIPGLAHSSPVVWGDKLFVTTAAKEGETPYFRHGLYGDGSTADDTGSVHQWVVYCLDRRTGNLIWRDTAREGLPSSGRHIKATHANCTPAVDGKRLLVFFGSEGLFAYSLDGQTLWKRDLGELDMGAYNATDYKWGFASSPTLYGDLAFIQCDTLQDDFLLALDADTGETRWRVKREELPSWSTPTVALLPGGPELVTNAPNWIVGYDPSSGEELWRLGGSSKITAPTPIFEDNLIVVASGRRPVKPIYVIRGGARGDITLPEGETSSERILWSARGRGPYMPTPLIYGDYLYVLANNGVFDCYELKTGKEIYRKRVQHGGGGFSASPVAADGKIYLAGEDGDVFVVASGPEYREIAVNEMDELLMATPAIVGGALYLRGRSHIFAIGKK